MGEPSEDVGATVRWAGNSATGDRRKDTVVSLPGPPYPAVVSNFISSLRLLVYKIEVTVIPWNTGSEKWYNMCVWHSTYQALKTSRFPHQSKASGSTASRTLKVPKSSCYDAISQETAPSLAPARGTWEPPSPGGRTRPWQFSARGF